MSTFVFSFSLCNSCSFPLLNPIHSVQPDIYAQKPTKVSPSLLGQTYPVLVSILYHVISASCIRKSAQGWNILKSVEIDIFSVCLETDILEKPVSGHSSIFQTHHTFPDAGGINSILKSIVVTPLLPLAITLFLYILILVISYIRKSAQS